jgi:flagellin
LAADLATALSADVAGTTVTSTGDGTGAGHKLQISWGSGGNHLGDYKLTHQDGTSVTGTVTQDGIDTASTAITTIDRALAAVASDRAGLGATQQQLESTVRNLANVAENTAAAQGRIMDTDYAAETANLTKAQILQQAATSILAQANAQPQAVLSLLQ